MPSLRAKLMDIIASAIPNNEENLVFCGSEGNYEEQGFYEMMNLIMETIVEHITNED